MRLVRKLGLISFVLAAVLVLSGCSFITFKNTTELLKAPALGAEQGELQKALSGYLKNIQPNLQPKYKFPKEGDLRSPLVMLDMNGDGQEEGILFYSVDDVSADKKKTNNVYAAILEKGEDGWQVVDDKEAPNLDIASVEIVDLFNDGTQQLLVGYSNGALQAKSMVIYRYQDGAYVNALGGDGKYMGYVAYCVADFYEDGREMVAIVSPAEQDTPRMNMSFYSAGNTGQLEISQNSIELYANFDSTRPVAFYPGKSAGGQSLIVVDGYTVAGKMASQFLDRSATGGEGYYSRNDKSNAEMAGETTRDSSLLAARDIDGDGVLEIPLDITSNGTIREIVTESSNVTLRYLTWVDFTGDEPVAKQFGILDVGRSIFVQLPPEWEGQVLIEDGIAAGEWVVKRAESGTELVSLRAITGSDTVMENVKRVPGDVDVFLVLSDEVTAMEKLQIKGTLLS